MAGQGAPAHLEMARGARVLIVEGRFHSALSDLLLDGARAALDRAEARHETATLPGALEIPAAIAIADEKGRFDAFVALGVVIRGQTFHFEIVATESSRGLTWLGVAKGLAIGNGILTVENEVQALERADPMRLDKGGAAAAAALSLLALRRRCG